MILVKSEQILNFESKTLKIIQAQDNTGRILKKVGIQKIKIMGVRSLLRIMAVKVGKRVRYGPMQVPMLILAQPMNIF